MVLLVKNLPTNAGDVRDAGLIPGLGISPRGDLLEIGSIYIIFLTKVLSFSF